LLPRRFDSLRILNAKFINVIWKKGGEKKLNYLVTLHIDDECSKEMKNAMYMLHDKICEKHKFTKKMQ